MVDIAIEYRVLLKRKQVIEKELPLLAKGSITNKTIHGKRYNCLKSKTDDNLTRVFFDKGSKQRVKTQLALRKQYEIEVSDICHRLQELEQAAKLIGNGLDTTLLLARVSVGMECIEE